MSLTPRSDDFDSRVTLENIRHSVTLKLLDSIPLSFMSPLCQGSGF